MKFQLERATPAGVQWSNGQGQRVVIINRKKHPVLASGSLMPNDVQAVVEANSKGLKQVVL